MCVCECRDRCWRRKDHHIYICTAYCFCSFISSVLNLNRCSRSRGHTYANYGPRSTSVLARNMIEKEKNTIQAYCIWSVISSIFNLNRCSRSRGHFCHIPLQRDQRDWDWRFRWRDIPNAIGCTCVCVCVCERERLNEISKAIGLYRVVEISNLNRRFLFNGTWQKRPRELEHRLRFQIEEMTLQMQ